MGGISDLPLRERLLLALQLRLGQGDPIDIVAIAMATSGANMVRTRHGIGNANANANAKENPHIACGPRLSSVPPAGTSHQAIFDSMIFLRKRTDRRPHGTRAA